MIRARLAAAVIAAGLEAVVGDGMEDALAGEAADKDAVGWQRRWPEGAAFNGARAGGKAKIGVGIASARQGAGLAVPELARAWTCVLLCADPDGSPTRRCTQPVVRDGSRKAIRPT